MAMAASSCVFLVFCESGEARQQQQNAESSNCKLQMVRNRRRLFECWARHHGRVYKSTEEKEYRFRVFKDSVDCIEEQKSCSEILSILGLNNFADLTQEELQAYCSSCDPPSELISNMLGD